MERILYLKKTTSCLERFPIDDADRIDDVSQTFRHFSALRIANDAVQQHVLKEKK